MPTERFTFEGHAGDELAARLDTPEMGHLATAVFAHCFTCGKDIAAARRISRRLCAMGIAVLRFDLTGLGHSGGEFANTTFATNAEDLVRAAQALEARGHPPALLVGHSLGGAAVLKAAPDIASARAVVAIGAPSDPAHVTRVFGDRLDEIRREGAAEVTLAARTVTIGRAFLDDIAEAKLTDAIGAMGKALLVLHSPVDEVVGIDNASDIFLAAKHPKSFVTLDDADHLLSRPEDAEYAAEVIAAWAGRYVDLPAPPPPEGAPEGVVRVSESDAGGFLQDVSAGPRHHLLADEPKDRGGTDEGMTPYQLLAAALGTCTSMTLRLYARRKDWPLAHVSVDVTHEKLHAEDKDHEGRIDRLDRTIHLEGDLTDDQRQRLLQIADRCPVHRTLTGEIRIETALAGT